MSLGSQVAVLFVLAIPIAAVAWTVTHEELFREVRDWLLIRSRSSRSYVARKFFYALTCEYCFSHYVTLAFLAITRYTLVYDDWRGSLVAGFSLVWVANLYMSAYGRLRLEIREEKLEIEEAETRVNAAKRQAAEGGRATRRGARGSTESGAHDAQDHTRPRTRQDT